MARIVFPPSGVTKGVFMNKFISYLSRLAAAFIVTASLNPVVVRAADAPANPAPPNATPAAPAPADNAAGGRQSRRGNPAPGNPNPGGNIQGGRGGTFGGGPGGGFNLDDKQRELFREASQNESDELRKLNDKLQGAQKDLVQAVVAEKYDEKAVREKAEAVSKIQTDITMLRAKAFSAVAPTLKPEQREHLDQNWRVGVGFIMGGGIGFGGGTVAGGGRGGPPVDVTQGGGRRGDPPDQPRRRGEQTPNP